MAGLIDFLGVGFFCNLLTLLYSFNIVSPYNSIIITHSYSFCTCTLVVVVVLVGIILAWFFIALRFLLFSIALQRTFFFEAYDR